MRPTGIGIIRRLVTQEATKDVQAFMKANLERGFWRLALCISCVWWVSPVITPLPIITTYTRVSRHERHAVPLEDFPNVKCWFDTIRARPAVQRDMEIPKV